MNWQEVLPGHYERPIDVIEKFYVVIADATLPLKKELYHISSTIKLKSSPPLEDLRNAWRSIRKQYPQIAATVDSTRTRFCYTVPSPEELEEWVQDSFIAVNDERISANEIFEGETPLATFRLYYMPHSRELLFQTPHWRIDSKGMMHLQSQLLQTLANGPPKTVHLDGSEAKNLAPPLDIPGNVPSTVTEAHRRAADEEMAIFLAHQPTISISTLPNIMPGTGKRTETRYSPETTWQIIQACKFRQISVTTAVHAALVMATLPHAQHNFDPTTRGSGGGTYAGINILDLRKYLPKPFNGPEAAVSVYHTCLPITVDLSQSKTFDAIATGMRETYKRDLSQNEPRNMFDMHTVWVEKVLETLGAPPSNPLHAPAHPELSSNGVIENWLAGRFQGPSSTVEVEDWWVAVQVIHRILMSNVWTFKGEMSLSINWNDAFYEQEFISGFVQEWKEALCDGLGVKLEN